MPPTPRPPGSEDHRLVAQVRQGDTAAFETIFYSYFAAVSRFASSFVGDRDVAEDLAQDVFGWIWLHRAEWDPAGDVLSYLLTAVRNRALDVLRAEKRHGEATMRYVDPGASPAMAAQAPAADAAVEQDERMATVWQVIFMLPEQRRTVLLLRWREGLEFEEIARILQTSVAAVRMHHSRALQALRERLPDGLE